MKSRNSRLVALLPREHEAAPDGQDVPERCAERGRDSGRDHGRDTREEEVRDEQDCAGHARSEKPDRYAFHARFVIVKERAGKAINSRRPGTRRGRGWLRNPMTTALLCR